jgi:hypothetical protein
MAVPPIIKHNSDKESNKIGSVPPSIPKKDGLKEKKEIIKEYEDLLRLKADLIEKEKGLLKRKEDAEVYKDYLLLDKIITLKNVMSSTFGSSSPFSEPSLGAKNLYSEEELYEYKHKMLQLIQQL